MPLPVLDPNQRLDPEAKFACSGCGWCCDQPWMTVISPEDAQRYAAEDWAAEFPQLRRRKLFTHSRRNGRTVYALTKSRGNRCIFLADDNRCIVHARLGLAAKPHMCRQFPYLPVTIAGTQRISVNYGCRAVQREHGPALAEQTADIAATIAPPKSTGFTAGGGSLPLLADVTLPAPTALHLIERLAAEFHPDSSQGVIVAFSRCIEILRVACSSTQRELDAWLQRDGALHGESTPPAGPAPKAADVPVASRMLFAATLYPDLCNPRRLGLLSRFRLLTRLMSLTQLRGVFASRLLGINIPVGKIFSSPPHAAFDAESDQLLARYFRARLWQLHGLGTGASIVAAIHQHILDLGAIVLYARALHASSSADPGRDAALHRFSLETMQRALNVVEFHLANQERLTSRILRGWFAESLNQLDVAASSLRLVWSAVAAPAESGA